MLDYSYPWSDPLEPTKWGGKDSPLYIENNPFYPLKSKNLRGFFVPYRLRVHSISVIGILTIPTPLEAIIITIIG